MHKVELSEHGLSGTAGAVLLCNCQTVKAAQERGSALMGHDNKLHGIAS
jgi:hypothetical protein